MATETLYGMPFKDLYSGHSPEHYHIYLRDQGYLCPTAKKLHHFGKMGQAERYVVPDHKICPRCRSLLQQMDGREVVEE